MYDSLSSAIFQVCSSTVYTYSIFKFQSMIHSYKRPTPPPANVANPGLAVLGRAKISVTQFYLSTVTLQFSKCSAFLLFGRFSNGKPAIKNRSNLLQQATRLWQLYFISRIMVGTNFANLYFLVCNLQMTRNYTNVKFGFYEYRSLNITRRID